MARLLLRRAATHTLHLRVRVHVCACVCACVKEERVSASYR